MQDSLKLQYNVLATIVHKNTHGTRNFAYSLTPVPHNTLVTRVCFKVLVVSELGHSQQVHNYVVGVHLTGVAAMRLGNRASWKQG